MNEQPKKEMTLHELILEHQRLTNQTLTFLDAIKDNTMKQVNIFMLIAKKLGDTPLPKNRAERRRESKKN